jgi:inner membrane protein
MPYAFSHAAIGLGLGSVLGPLQAPRRFWVLAAGLAALPDADLIGLAFHVPDTSLLRHRALTHSLLFAVVVGGLVAWLGFRGSSWAAQRLRLWVTFTLVIASHGFFDALTGSSVGIEFFAPFTQQRYRFAWQPLPGRDWPWGVLRDEALWVLLPALLLGVGGLARRHGRHADPPAVAS